METTVEYPLDCKLKGVSALADCPSLHALAVGSRIHEGIVDLASNSIKEAPLAATHRISGPNVASFLYLLLKILLFHSLNYRCLLSLTIGSHSRFRSPLILYLSRYVYLDVCICSNQQPTSDSSCQYIISTTSGKSFGNKESDLLISAAYPD